MARNNYKELKGQLIDAMYDKAGGAALLRGLPNPDIAALMGREFDNAIRVALTALLHELHDEGTILTIPGAGRVKDYILVDNIRDPVTPLEITQIIQQIEELKGMLRRISPTMISMDMPSTLLISRLVGENRFLWNFVKQVERVVGKAEEVTPDGEQKD